MDTLSGQSCRSNDVSQCFPKGWEGLTDLRVGSFKVVEDEIWGHRSWTKVVILLVVFI